MATISISITPQFGNNTVTEIDCGTSSPRLGGTVDISAFPNLREFRCNNNDITLMSGYNQNSNLIVTQFVDNNLTGSIPSLSAMTSLRNFQCHTNQFTGSIPSLNGLINLRNYNSHTNQLTGPIPSLIGLVELRDFSIHTNQLTGSIPSLSGLPLLQNFAVHTNQLTNFAGGSVSITLGDFQAQNNQLPQSSINAILSAFVVANKTTGTRVLTLGGSGNAAPSYTGGVTTTSAGSSFTRSGTLVTVTNIIPHGHVTGDIVTIDGDLAAIFLGTFVVTRITNIQFQYTTLSSGSDTGSAAQTATMRKTSDPTSGYASYQNLALVSRTGGPWTITINQP